MQNTNKDNLKKANEAFKKGMFQEAHDLYLLTIKNDSRLEKFVSFNITLCLKQLGQNIKTQAEIKQKPSPQITQPSGDLKYQQAFDVEYYLKTYPDIKAANVDPFVHYSNWGWMEQRSPNSWFDPIFYRETYKDIASIDYDPLLHYLNIGEAEKRKTKDPSISSVPKSIKNLIPQIKFDNTEEGFVDYRENEKVTPFLKTLAFYLPQFHPFPENDNWWGKGFTEWTNVTKASANFKGHYQPHLPIHNGFYDLRVPEVLIEQAKLAKNYGIHGFNFYYYWFDGKVLMHKPFEILLKHKEIDINFCLTWANENWTRRWDGADHDVLIGQNHCDEDSTKLINHLFKYFNDERYIRIDDKPVLIIYRANIIPEIADTLKLWRSEVKKAGFKGIYLICAQTFGYKDPTEHGFDAAVEFPPHTVKSNTIDESLEIINSKFDGKIYSYDEVVLNATKEKPANYKKYNTAMLSWDNTARKQNASHIFANFSILKYKQWLANISFNTVNNEQLNENEKFIFINAWNEWAEGTHLEPDAHRGYSYLQNTYEIIKLFNNKNKKFILKQKFSKKNDFAIVLHLHYSDVWDEIVKYLKNIQETNFDLYITLTNDKNEILEKIHKEFPEANISIVENRGRDIRPFILTYKNIRSLGYKAICKIHSKKSMYRNDGNQIRAEIFDILIGDKEKLKNILDAFSDKKKNIGLIAPSKYLIEHNNKNMTYDFDIVRSISEYLEFDFEFSVFPAGSMFWFKPESLEGLEKIEDHFFEVEEGLADGTLAHAIERIFVSLIKNNGFEYHSL